MARWNAEPVDSDWFDQNAPPENSAGPVDARPLDSGQDQAAAITRAFQQYLGRTPRPDEIAFHSQDPQFAYHIQNSPEAQAYQRQRAAPQRPAGGGARTPDQQAPGDFQRSPGPSPEGQNPPPSPAPPPPEDLGYAPIGGYDFGKLSDPAHVGEGKYNPDVKLYSQALKALNYVPGSGFYPSGATLDEIVKWINAHGGQVSRNKDVLKFGSGVEVDTATDFREEGNPNSQFSFQDPRGRAPGYGTATAAGDAGGSGPGPGAGAGAGGLSSITGAGAASSAGGGPNDLLSPFPGQFAYPSFEPPPAFQAPTGAEIWDDPGVQARMDWSQRAIERAAASKGALNTGGTLRQIAREQSDLGAQEYGQLYNRKMGEYQQQGGNARGDYATDYNKWLGEFNLARNQWNEGQDRPFNKLASIAGLGQTSQQNLGALGANYSGQYGNTLSNMAQGQGDYWTQGANARAAGQVGGSNAWTDALSGIARTWAPQMYGGRSYGGYW